MLFSWNPSPLRPTSLTYIILLARGFSPWRPVADMSTARGKVRFFRLVPTAQFLVFKDRRRRTGSDEKTARLCRPRQAHLQTNCFRALSETHVLLTGVVKKKRKLFPGPTQALPCSFTLPSSRCGHPARDSHTVTSISQPWRRNINRLPFRQAGARSNAPSFREALA